MNIAIASSVFGREPGKVWVLPSAITFNRQPE
jgi:hypothetical protein